MATSKSSAQKMSATSKQTSGPKISEQERERMIAEAAYFNSEHRGFQSGDPLQDWFLAEEQIERQLNS